MNECDKKNPFQISLKWVVYKSEFKYYNLKSKNQFILTQLFWNLLPWARFFYFECGFWKTKNPLRLAIEKPRMRWCFQRWSTCFVQKQQKTVHHLPGLFLFRRECWSQKVKQGKNRQLNQLWLWTVFLLLFFQNIHWLNQ